MTVGDPPRAGRKEWLGLAVLSLPTLLVALDVFVLLLALPHLAVDLHANSTQQLWIMDIYGFMIVGFLVTMGTLGDRIGRRKLLLIGAAAFGAASVLAAFSTSPGMLIAARVALGIAGATLTPSTLALISNLFMDPKQRAMAISVWASLFPLGAIIGPIIGGVMLEHFWWGSVFLLGVPAMVLLLIAGPKLLPEFRNENAGKLDPLSVVLTLGASVPVIYGIKELARNGWHPVPVIALVVGVALGVLFVRRQRTLSEPLLDVGLFAHSRFSAALVGMLANSVVGGTVMLLLTQYFQSVQGLSPLKAALGLMPSMALATVGFMVTPMLARKIRPAYVVGGGLAGVVAVLLVLARMGTGSGTATLIVGFALFSFFGTPVVALGTNLVVEVVPPEKAGSAGSMSQLGNEFGAALGVATLGTLGLAVYRNEIADQVPAGLPAAAADAVRDSVAGASGAAASLPDKLAAALSDPVREAFMAGLHSVAAVGAVLIAAAGLAFVLLLKHVPPIGQAEEDPAPDEDAPTGAAPEADGTPGAKTAVQTSGTDGEPVAVQKDAGLPGRA
ncbi:MFS transporter [Streptomyces sp. PTD5-9]|uniref:MFS transporter n=1 Tax=Streptomyces sp. PTD5-9 TaxID=3120150 RepID=UPI003009A5B4